MQPEYLYVQIVLSPNNKQSFQCSSELVIVNKVKNTIQRVDRNQKKLAQLFEAHRQRITEGFGLIICDAQSCQNGGASIE